MKLVKSLLLGSAAGLAAVAGAQAADLPVKKAAPVEYVRVCSTYGAGFFYVPGTDSCLRISGRLRVDFGYLEPFSRADDAIGIRVRGRVNFDHRTATPYGLLRTYIRYEIDRNSGRQFGVNGHDHDEPEAAAGLHPVRRPHRRSRDVVLLEPRPAHDAYGHAAVRRRSGRRPPRLHLLLRQRLLGHPVGRRRAVTARRHRAERPGWLCHRDRRNGHDLRRLVLRERRPAAYSPPARFCTAATARPISSRTSATRAFGAACSCRARFTRSATSRSTPASTPSLRSCRPSPTRITASRSACSAYVNIPWLGAGDNAWIYGTYTDGAIAYINGGQDCAELWCRVCCRERPQRLCRRRFRERLQRQSQDGEGLVGGRRRDPLLDAVLQRPGRG